MAGEREVLVKLGIKPIPGADKPLNEMSMAAGRADKSVHSLTMKLRTEVIELTRGKEAARAMTRELEGWNKAQIAGVAALEKKAEALRKAKAAEGKGLQDLKAGAGQITAGIGMLGVASRVGFDASDLIKGLSGRGSEMQFQGMLGQASQSLVSAMDAMEQAIGSDIVGRQAARKSLDEMKKAAEQNAKALQASAAALSRWESQRSRAQGSIASETGLAAMEAEITGKGPMGVIDAQVSGTGKMIEESRRELARIEKLKADNARKEAQFEVQVEDERRAREKDTAERHRRGPIGAAGMGPAPGGMSQKQIDDQRAAFASQRLGAEGGLASEQAKLERLQHDMLKLEKQRLDLMKAEGKERAGILKDELKSLKDQEKQLREIAERERERLQSLKEQFGFMKPEEQQAIKDVAAKLKAGKELTADELQFAQGKQGFFGEQLSKIGGARGDAAGFAEVVKMLGLDRKAKEAEAAADIKAQVAIEVKEKLEITLKADAAREAVQVAELLGPIFEAFRRERDLAIAAAIRNERLKVAANQ